MNDWTWAIRKMMGELGDPAFWKVAVNACAWKRLKETKLGTKAKMLMMAVNPDKTYLFHWKACLQFDQIAIKYTRTRKIVNMNWSKWFAGDILTYLSRYKLIQCPEYSIKIMTLQLFCRIWDQSYNDFTA